MKSWSRTESIQIGLQMMRGNEPDEIANMITGEEGDYKEQIAMAIRLYVLLLLSTPST